MRVIYLVLVVAALSGPGMAAQVSSDLQSWFQGPVQHLMTPEEQRQWHSLGTEEEARDFVDLFWARRDPSPGTPENEWKAEFEVRVGLADQQFTTLKTRGAMSDRGKLLILLGAPSQIGSRGAGARASGMGEGMPQAPGENWDGQVASARPESARQTWTYSGDRKPEWVRQKDLEILFVDDSGRSEWTYASTERVNLNHILQEAVKRLIFTPDLSGSQVPAVASTTPARPTTLENTTLQRALDEFRGSGEPTLGLGRLTWGEFVTTAGQPFIAVQIFVPEGAAMAGEEMILVARFQDAETGELVDIQSVPVTLAVSGRDAYADHSFELPAGTYDSVFGLARGDRFETLQAAEIATVGLDPAASGISSLILSNNAFALPEGQFATDPFAFGGLKIVPKGDLAFSTSDEMWYWFELRNPGLADTGMPKVRVKVDIEGTAAADQRPLRFEFPPQEMETIALKGAENRFGLGMAYPLADFAPGEYTIRITVFDAVLRQNYSDRKAFTIR